MKKLFAIVLAVVMVLGVASSALAFTWNASAGTTTDTFANRYKIEVVKLANETGIIGTNKLIEAPGATAVNNAPVYFYIRLTVAGAEADATKGDAVQEAAKADVAFTALSDIAGAALGSRSEINLSDYDNGVYYFDTTVATGTEATPANTYFKPITTIAAAAIEGRCLDTATAKVYAEAYAKRDLKVEFQSNGYYITLNGDAILFANDAAATPATKSVTFNRRGDGKVYEALVSAGTDANWTNSLYSFLGFTAADISAGNVYMTDANLRAALGFAYSGSSNITWAANSTPIILDPAIGIGIPKTGDNASVIGFAMIMVAVVAAAVAVKKVNA